MCEAGPLHPKMHFRGILLFKEIYRTFAQDKLLEGSSSVLIKKPKIKVFEVFEKRCSAQSVSASGQLPLLCWTYLFIFGLWSRFGMFGLWSRVGGIHRFGEIGIAITITRHATIGPNGGHTPIGVAIGRIE